MRKLLLTIIACVVLGSLGFGQGIKITGGAKITGGGKGAAASSQLACTDLASQTVTDNFNRANNADLGTAWNTPIRPGNSAFSIDSNQAAPGTGTSSEYYNPSTYKDPSSYAQIKTITALATNDSPRLFFNLVDGIGTATVDGYILSVNKSASTDTWTLQRLDNNTPTSLTPTTGSTTQEFAANDWLGYIRVDSSGLIRVCYKPSAGSWTEIATYTDTTYQTAGNVGIGISLNTDIRLEDFSVAAH